MALVYKSICNEVDSLFVYIMHLTEKEVRYKVEMEKLMHKGYIFIAKARYIMGSTCVTKMQLPSESSNPIKPVATVCRAEKNNHWVFHIHRTDKNPPSSESFEKLDPFSITNNVESVGNIYFKSDTHPTHNPRDKSGSAFKKLLKTDPKALKKSKTAFNVDDMLYKDYNDELLDELSTDSESNGSLDSVTDPIRLFGILVPNTLKQAQAIFKDVVNLLGKCATIQSELGEVSQRYNYLLGVKSLIEAAAKDIKMEVCKPRVYWTPSTTSTITHHTITDEIEEEEDKKEKAEDSESTAEDSGKVSVKSIRSVFYDLTSKNDDDVSDDEDDDDNKTDFEREIEQEQEEEQESDTEIWGSEADRSDVGLK